MEHKQLTASIVVCTRNRVHDLIRFLDSLSRQTGAIKEIIIVDSSDDKVCYQSDFASLFAPENFGATQLLYVHTEPGLTYQRNRGIRVARGDVIYFFDDDIVLEPDYIEHMQKFFAEHPECAGAMGSVTNIPEYRLNAFRLFRKFFLLQRTYSTGMFTRSGMPTHTYGTNSVRPVSVLGGCCMAYRSDVFKKHIFDENLRFYSYMEDCDFSARVAQSHTLYYNPAARCKHFHSDLNRDSIEKNRAMYIKNYSYLFFKNFYHRNRLSLFAYAWSVAGLFLEACIFRRDMRYIRGYWRGLKEYYSH